MQEFKYNKVQRWGPTVCLPFFLLISYGFFKEVLSFESWLYSSICLIISGYLTYISIKAFYTHLTKIKTNEKGVLICKPFRSIFNNWDDITEYGKYRVLVFASSVWCFYIKSKKSDKKIILGLEYYQNLKELNNIIIQNAKKARLVNIE